MRALQQWSFAQVLLVSLAWVVLVVALAAGFIYWQIRAAMAESGSGGIGAVSGGLGPLIIIVAVVIGPPVGLMTAWLILRRPGGGDSEKMATGPDKGADVVQDHREASRFELVKDGHVAFLTYERRPDAFVLAHTEVPAALQGTGVGTRLVKGALELARAEQRPLIVNCPFVSAYLKKHPEAG